MIASSEPKDNPALPLSFNYEFRDGKLIPTDEHPLSGDYKDYTAAMREAGYSYVASDNQAYPIVSLYENDEACKWPWVIVVAPAGNLSFDVFCATLLDLLQALNLLRGLMAFSAAWVIDDHAEHLLKVVKGQR